MNVQKALILLLSAIAISARSLKGYKCREYPIFTGDPSAPLRTVRVCEAMGYEAVPNYFQTASQIEDQVRRLLPSNNLYSGDSIWPRPVFQESSKSWPSQSQSYNNDGEQLLPFQTQSIPLTAYASEMFNQIGITSNNPSTNNNELKTRTQMEVEGSLQLQLDVIARDVSEVQHSITNLVETLDSLNMQSVQGNSEETVNVNFKLDPSFEALLEELLQLTKASTKKKEVQTPLRSVDVGSIYSTEVTTEESPEENTTEVQDNTDGSSSEQDSREKSEEDRTIEKDMDSWISFIFGPSVNAPISDEELEENLDNWLRLHFGPSVNNARISREEIEILKKISEKENSAEKSDESFETWFNAVYRRVPSETTNDYNSVESTQSSSESNENVQKESKENSKEDSRENKYEDEISKSSEASKESSENIDNGDRKVDYETFFVPTTMGTIQEDTTAEYLENGNRYGYAVESISNVKPASSEVSDISVTDSNESKESEETYYLLPQEYLR